MDNTKPLLINGPLLINPDKVLWANIEAVLPKGTGVQIQFEGQPAPSNFYDGDAGAAASILMAASEVAPNA